MPQRGARRRVAMTAGMACLMLLTGAAMAGDQPTAPAPTISADEQDVYETVLAGWLGKETQRQQINVQLSPPPAAPDDDLADCAKGLDFPPPAKPPAPDKSLAGVAFRLPGVVLVDGSRWRADDPGDAIAGGKSVDAAVTQGISHSLISFSQIAFSRDHKDALVRFGMVCGRLCGTGSVMHLRRTGAHWKVLGDCGGRWIS